MNRGRKRKKVEGEKHQDSKRQKKDHKAVIFCPYTNGGELAKKLREAKHDL